MFGFVVLINLADIKSLLGSVPESLGVFIFGVILIAVTIGLRWVLKRKIEKNADDEAIHISV